MNNNLIIRITLLLIVYVLATNCDTKDKNNKNSGATRQKLEVNAVIADYTMLEQELTISGTIIPDETVDLHPETPGKLVELNIEEGKKVTKGQLLARVNDNEVRARLKKLYLDLELAQQDLERKQKLKEINALSQQETDVAQNKVDGLKAEIDLAKAQIEKSEIRAPFDGQIGLRSVSLGSYISTTTVVASIIKDNPVKIEFYIPERYVDGIVYGKEVEFTLGHNPKIHKAHIYATDAAIDQGTRAMKVRALAQNSNRDLIPGSFVKVKFTMSDIPKALLIPPHALIPILDGQSVAKITNGVVNITPVEIGTRTATSVEIVDGLVPGDTMLISGLLQIRQGMSVNVSIQSTW